MKNKFSNAKVGDKVWDVLYGSWGEIVKIYKDNPYPLLIEFKFGQNCYSLDGIASSWDKYPRLYWNEVKLPTNEEDKKPFDLKEELLKYKKNICEFKEDECCSIGYSKTFFKKTYFLNIPRVDIVGGIYFTCLGNLIELLNEHRIDYNELKKTMKELGM